MPLKTYFNLPEDTQKIIIDTCIAEFAVNDFESASIARIIKKLHLARGSFYRYFENKIDLYQYLFKEKLNIIEKLKKEYIANSKKDFFDAWIDFGIALLKVEIEHPLYLAFLARVTQERRTELFGETRESREEKRMEIFGKMVRFHRKTGQIRNDIPVQIQTLFLINTREGIRQYLVSRYKLNFNDPSYHNNPFFTIPNHKIQKELSGFVQLLRDALENPDWKNKNHSSGKIQDE